MRRLIIAIDGPAGAGKSTVARMLAQRLGYLWLDTGAMYRAVGLRAIREGVPFDDEERITELARTADIKLVPTPSGNRVLLDGEDVTERIRQSDVSWASSAVAVHKGVRERLVELQRQMSEHGGVVAEGRDTTTVVFPNADLKIYLDASIEERARRRARELKEKGEDVEFDKVLEEVKKRDLQDSNRAHSPLRRAEDAIYIDTTDMGIEEVVARIEEEVRKLTEEENSTHYG